MQPWAMPLITSWSNCTGAFLCRVLRARSFIAARPSGGHRVRPEGALLPDRPRPAVVVDRHVGQRRLGDLAELPLVAEAFRIDLDIDGHRGAAHAFDGGV